MRRLHQVIPGLAAAVLLAACGGQPAPRKVARTTPKPPPAAAARPGWDPAVLTDEELAGQLLMPYAYGTGADAVSPAARTANQKLAGVGTPAEMVREYRLGGLILVRGSAGDPTSGTNATSNIAGPSQVRELTAGLQRASGQIPLLIGTDQEHGVVTRVREGMTLLPSAMAFGAAADPGLTEQATRVAGGELAAVGVNVDFAPVADVTGGPSNTVIGSRSYGSAPSPVARQLAAAVRGYESAGVAATLKHFPGHGHTAIDSHRALPVLRQDKATLTREDLAPFAAGIQAGASIVMTGHLRVLAVDRSEPATFSKPLVTGVLRGELGFTGVVITDAMNMAAVAGRYPPGEAAVRAVLAGSDVVMMPPDVRAARDGLLAAIRSGRLPRAQARASAGRILALKAKLAGADQPAVSTLRSAQHTAVAGRAAREAITVLRGPCAGPLVRGPVRVAGGTAAQRRTLAAALAADGVPSGRGPVVRLTGYGDGPKDLRPAAATIALDTPYVLASAHSPVLLAAYSSVPDSLRAVAAVLAGKARATGRLPVTVPHTAKCGNSAGP